MNIAITTAGGQLGRAIIQVLKNTMGDDKIIGIARTPGKAKDLGVEIRKGDYNFKGDFLSAFEGIDVSLIVSGMDAPDKRIGQHRNVIEAAKESGVKKIVYTSIYGKEGKSSFDAIIKSNRQTEKDVKASGLEWAIGRNGLYIDADLEAVGEYEKAGHVMNCAGEGKCAYTSRNELACAYAALLRDDGKSGKTYNLCGEAVTQAGLVAVLNEVFQCHLSFKSISFEEYVKDRINAHGEFLGQIIAGIYQGIQRGAFELPSDFESACGRPHLSLRQMAESWKRNKSKG